jgi:hypothetical protein
VTDASFVAEGLRVLEERVALARARAEGSLDGAPPDWDPGDDYAGVLPRMARGVAAGTIGLHSRKEALLAARASLAGRPHPRELEGLLAIALGLSGGGDGVADELRAMLAEPPASWRLRTLLLRSLGGLCRPPEVPALIRLLSDPNGFMPLEPPVGGKDVFTEYPVRDEAAARLRELGMECPVKTVGKDRYPALDAASAVDRFRTWLGGTDREVAGQALASVGECLAPELVEGLRTAVAGWEADPSLPAGTRKALGDRLRASGERKGGPEGGK